MTATTRTRTTSWERRAAAKRARLAAAAADDPRYAEPPADVRETGLRAMTAAAETTVDAEQIYARTLAALWPHAVAAAVLHVDVMAVVDLSAELDAGVDLGAALDRVEAGEERLAAAEKAERETGTSCHEEYLLLVREVLVAVAWLAADYADVALSCPAGSPLRAMAARASAALYGRVTRDAGSDEQAVLATAHERRRAARRAAENGGVRRG